MTALQWKLRISDYAICSTSGELLQLVINHEQFAWLHSISELIVRIIAEEVVDTDGE